MARRASRFPFFLGFGAGVLSLWGGVLLHPYHLLPRSLTLSLLLGEVWEIRRVNSSEQVGCGRKGPEEQHK